MKDRIPAMGFRPGDLIKEELEARGWTQDDLAEIVGRTPSAINEIVSGKRGITVETAKELGEAFGTGAQFWLNMESAYRLFLKRSVPGSISRKAALYGTAPVRAMVKRGWIRPSSSIDVLEQELRDFFGTQDLGRIPELAFLARKSTDVLTDAQRAWLFRAKSLAQAVRAKPYSKDRLISALDRLKLMLADEADIGSVPEVLADAGVKLLIVEPLPQSKIDGISFWHNGTPVVVLSLRYDRIDSFWHTLMHELGHIKNEDGLKDNRIVIDADLFDERDDDRPAYERRADEFAVKFLLPQADLKDFIARTRPLYSKAKIVSFASRLKVHPGIVLGQLHHRKEVEYSHSREMLTRIRHLITTSALTDGYGHVPGANLNSGG